MIEASVGTHHGVPFMPRSGKLLDGSWPPAPQTSYNERTLLATQRPVYTDWKGDAGQDPMMSDVEYKTRLEESSGATLSCFQVAATVAGCQPRAALLEQPC